MHAQTESVLYPVEEPNKSMYAVEEDDEEESGEKMESQSTSKLNDEKMEDDAIKLSEAEVNCGCCMLKESKYVLILFTLTNIFLFADQNLLAPNLTVIANEYGMTDDERDLFLGGYISLGFFAVGGTVSMLVGYLADKINRKKTFAAAVIIGELSCLMTVFVSTASIDDFWGGLWLTRAITGVAIGGAVPIQFSIFGDYFSEENRGKAAAFIQIAVGIGAGFGQVLAGVLSPDWRLPFVIVSVPAFFMVGLYYFTTNEPKRGAVEKALQDVKVDEDVEHTISWLKLRNLFSRPTFLLILLQGLPGILPWGVGQVFLNDYLIVEKNLTAGEAALVIPVQGVGIGLATLFAGFLGDYLWNNDKKLWIPVVAGVSTICATFPMLGIIDAPPLGTLTYLLVLPPTGMIAGMGGTLMKMILINITLPETRGTAFAFQSLVDDLGRGVGPFFVSLLILSTGSRDRGIYIGYLGWIPCGMVMLCIIFTLKPDIARNESELKISRKRRLSL